MDTGKDYILMCEAAVGIQELMFGSNDDFMKILPAYIFDKEMNRICICIWTPKTLEKELGDSVVQHKINVSIEQDNDGNIYKAPKGGAYGEVAIWLPRQDQLQGLLSEKLDYQKFSNTFKDLAKFEDSLRLCFDSMEQLWLAFVMSERWNKKWDGKQWRKERG